MIIHYHCTSDNALLVQVQKLMKALCGPQSVDVRLKINTKININTASNNTFRVSWTIKKKF